MFTGDFTAPLLTVANQCILAENSFMSCQAPSGGDCCVGFSMLVSAFTSVAVDASGLSTLSPWAPATTIGTVPLSLSTSFAVDSSSATSNHVVPFARDSALSGAALIGGVVGGMVALVVIVALVCVLMSRRSRELSAHDAPSVQTRQDGVILAAREDYSDVNVVRAPPNEYEAVQTPLRV